MSKDLSRVTAVNKSLDWAREIFQHVLCLGKWKRKFLLAQETFLSTQRGVRGQRVNYRKDKCPTRMAVGSGPGSSTEGAVFLSVTRSSIFAARQDFFTVTDSIISIRN